MNQARRRAAMSGQSGLAGCAVFEGYAVAIKAAPRGASANRGSMLAPQPLGQLDYADVLLRSNDCQVTPLTPSMRLGRVSPPCGLAVIGPVVLTAATQRTALPAEVPMRSAARRRDMPMSLSHSINVGGTRSQMQA